VPISQKKVIVGSAESAPMKHKNDSCSVRRAVHVSGCLIVVEMKHADVVRAESSKRKAERPAPVVTPVAESRSGEGRSVDDQLEWRCGVRSGLRPENMGGRTPCELRLGNRCEWPAAEKHGRKRLLAAREMTGVEGEDVGDSVGDHRFIRRDVRLRAGAQGDRDSTLSTPCEIENRLRHLNPVVPRKGKLPSALSKIHRSRFIPQQLDTGVREWLRSVSLHECPLGFEPFAAEGRGYDGRAACEGLDELDARADPTLDWYDRDTRPA